MLRKGQTGNRFRSSTCVRESFEFALSRVMSHEEVCITDNGWLMGYRWDADVVTAEPPSNIRRLGM